MIHHDLYLFLLTYSDENEEEGYVLDLALSTIFVALVAVVAVVANVIDKESMIRSFEVLKYPFINRF